MCVFTRETEGSLLENLAQYNVNIQLKYGVFNFITTKTNNIYIYIYNTYDNDKGKNYFKVYFYLKLNQ